MSTQASVETKEICNECLIEVLKKFPYMYEHGEELRDCINSAIALTQERMVVKELPTRERILQLLQDSSEQYGETYEQRAIYDSNFGELADCIIKMITT